MSVYPPDAEVRRSARLSSDINYRYALSRNWRDPMDVSRCATFIMLNPSTADAELDDPTIRRCVTFARAFGCNGLAVVNLYAFRATKPADLWRADDPVGPKNDAVLETTLRYATLHRGPVIAAWGAHAKSDRVTHVVDLAWRVGVPLSALGLTKDGAPRHPLYLPATARPVPFGGA